MITVNLNSNSLVKTEAGIDFKLRLIRSQT